MLAFQPFSMKSGMRGRVASADACGSNHRTCIRLAGLVWIRDMRSEPTHGNAEIRRTPSSCWRSGPGIGGSSGAGLPEEGDHASDRGGDAKLTHQSNDLPPVIRGVIHDVEKCLSVGVGES